MRPKQDTIWLKAAIIGSLWAGNEIIVGSFLHNIRFPFSGTILSVVSVALMVGFLQVWKEKGIILRAGLICALMKSISPSAIIIGPMTGILAEALLMEAFIMLAGRNILGFLLGGIAGVLSALVHKVVTLLVIYGLDFVRVLENMYLFAARQLSLENITPSQALLILCLIYALAGVVAVITGIYAGNRAKRINVGLLQQEKDPDKLSSILPETNEQHNNLLVILFLLAGMVLSLLLLNGRLFYAGLVVSAAYAAFLVYTYKRSMRYLKKPGFWIQIALLVLASAIFWKGFSLGNPFDTEGLLAGLKMMVRAVVIVTGFGAVSVEMRSPVVREILVRRGFSRLYGSMEVAFAILPDVVESSVRPKDILFRPAIALARLIARGEAMLETKSKSQATELVLLTGEKDTGKTTLLQEMVSILREDGIRIGGILSLKHFEDGRISGYDLYDISLDKKIPLCRDRKQEGFIRQGKFYFDPYAIKYGNEAIMRPVDSSGLLIVDEVGPMELSGRGWVPALDVLARRKAMMIWVVRRSILPEVIRKWDTRNYIIVNVKDCNPAYWAEKIKMEMSRKEL